MGAASGYGWMDGWIEHSATDLQNKLQQVMCNFWVLVVSAVN